MANKLISNTSVIYNSETQVSGTLEISAEQITFQNDGNGYENVMLQMPVRVSGSGELVAKMKYNVDSDSWSTFYSSSVELLSPDTGNYDEVLETALHYTRVQIDGKWGLEITDWDFN